MNAKGPRRHPHSQDLKLGHTQRGTLEREHRCGVQAPARPTALPTRPPLAGTLPGPLCGPKTGQRKEGHVEQNGFLEVEEGQL